MYTITDNVELGHNNYIGGTVEIQLQFNSILNEEDKILFLGLIDMLDHTIITQDEETIEYTTRYFLIDTSKSLLEDIVSVVYHMCPENFKNIICTVTIGKEQFTHKVFPFSKIISYSIKD